MEGNGRVPRPRPPTIGRAPDKISAWLLNSPPWVVTPTRPERTPSQVVRGRPILPLPPKLPRLVALPQWLEASLVVLTIIEKRLGEDLGKEIETPSVLVKGKDAGEVVITISHVIETWSVKGRDDGEDETSVTTSRPPANDREAVGALVAEW